MSFPSNAISQIWLLPLGLLSGWLVNVGVRKLLAKRKSITESVADNTSAEIHSLETWLREEGTEKIVLMP